MLPNYQNILVTTDLTPNSEHAFKHAIMLARNPQARLHLLHVVPNIDDSLRRYVSVMVGESMVKNLNVEHEKQARDEIKHELDDFIRTELASYPEDQEKIDSVEVINGHPAETILNEAKRLNADVIVMGSHGKGALEHAFLGSVAEKVLRKTTVPVFIIPISD